MSHRLLATAALVLAAALPTAAASAATAPPSGKGCDRLDDAACLLPFPNDAFTRKDRHTATGLRLALRPEADAAQRRRASRSTRPTSTAWTASAPARSSSRRSPAWRRPGRCGARTRSGSSDARRLRPQVRAGPAARRAHRRAPADLGRARQQRRARARPPARDPPGAQPHRGPALRRRAARPAHRSGRRIKARRRFARAARRRRAHDALRPHLPDAEEGGGAPRARALPDLGLHRGQPPLAVGADARASATTPSPSSATATSPTASCRAPRRASRSARPRSTATTRSTARAGARCSRGRSRSRATSTSPGAPRARRFNLGTDGLPAQLPGNVLVAHFFCVVPRTATAGRARAGVALRPRAARQRPRGPLEPRPPGHGRGARHRLLRDAVEGHVERGHPQRHQRAAGPRQDAVDRRPAAAGHAQRALPRAADDPPAGPGRQPAAPAGAGGRSSAPTTSTTTATARAGSWAAR